MENRGERSSSPVTASGLGREDPGRGVAGLPGPRRLWVRLRTEMTKRFGLGHSVDELSAALAGKQLYFSSPPLDADLIRAIRAITPQFSLREDETSRRVWELSQNGSSWAEYEALRPLLDGLEEPERILEIGPGMGRSVVFLSRRLGWTKALFDLYDSDGPARKYPIGAPRSESSFCGDLGQLRRVLEHNGVDNARLFDAADLAFKLEGLPGSYELIYSFYGVGFHWSLADFWDEIRGLMAPGAIAVFTVHRAFEEFDALARVPHCYVPFRRVLAKDRPLNLLVVAEDHHRLQPWLARADSIPSRIAPA